MKQEAIGGSVGTILGVIGTTAQTNETLQTISLIITIVGAVLTIITTCVIPLIKWFINAKKDGVIDDQEIEEGKSWIAKLIDAIHNLFKHKGKEEEDK